MDKYLYALKVIREDLERGLKKYPGDLNMEKFFRKAVVDQIKGLQLVALGEFSENHTQILTMLGYELSDAYDNYLELLK